MLIREEKDLILSANELAAADLPDEDLGMVKPKPRRKQSYQERQEKRKYPNQLNRNHTHSLYL